ncbi:hypothetical protein ACWKWU_13225 [Chitinophaga lutea]
MSYLLIGNISALISEDCIEPLQHARIRIYVPAGPFPPGHPDHGMDEAIRLQSERDLSARADRLLADAALDAQGNFSASWDELHLFTEPLELDICLHSVPGQTGQPQSPRQFRLGMFMPQWKKQRDKYLGAFAYVIPPGQWAGVLREFGAWAVSGVVRSLRTREAMANIRVEAYNAANDRLLAQGATGPEGRYRLYFSRKDMHGSRLLQLLRDGHDSMDAPDVYFRLYSGGRLLRQETREAAQRPGRRRLPHCARINHFLLPPAPDQKTHRLTGWISDLIHPSRTKVMHRDGYVMY